LPSTLSQQVLPLYSGPLKALAGLDWKGGKLPSKGSEGANQVSHALTAVGEFIDSTIPVVSQAKRVHQLGAQAFNPLRPTAPATQPSTARVVGRVKLGGTAGTLNGTGRIKLTGTLNGEHGKLNGG